VTYGEAEQVAAILDDLGHHTEVDRLTDGWIVVLLCGCSNARGGRCGRCP
jgi:hypothetical protein